MHATSSTPRPSALRPARRRAVSPASVSLLGTTNSQLSVFNAIPFSLRYRVPFPRFQPGTQRADSRPPPSLNFHFAIFNFQCAIHAPHFHILHSSFFILHFPKAVLLSSIATLGSRPTPIPVTLPDTVMRTSHK